MPNLRRIEAAVPAIREKKKVAAYARVSMQSERMLHSLSAQVSYYSGLIQKNPDWEYAGVYADDFISGTNTVKRDEFKRMLADCEAGKIDIILTKSISRFARNTVDLLETVRHLKDLGVEVRFEKERIRSMDGDGELMLTILASFAQEESRSISDNVKWGIRKRMQNGIPNGHFRIYGYRWEGDELVIVPEEAEIVKRIFQNFLDGKSRLETERELAAEGITTRDGCRWVDSNIKVVLTNVTYTGNLLLQKEFISDPISKQRKKNRGELPRYYVEDTHPAIIDKATFDFVQEEMARRRELGALANKSLNTSCFTGKIKCPYCGQSYMHNKRVKNGNVTKSVSRFARNTVDSLTTVRMLKEKGVEIYFEKENIWTLDAKGELLITIMSSLAQEESRSISENTTWGQRKRFADGKASVAYKRFLGYDRGPNGGFVVNQEQAKTVKLIYKLFLDGLTCHAIAKELTERKLPTPGGKAVWSQSTVRSILTNEKYKGDALLQKEFTVDFLQKKTKKNEGEVPQYYVEGNHEAIIDPATFDYVQAEMARRTRDKHRYSGVSMFSSKIKCGECGCWYGSKVWHSTDKYRRVIYQCNHKYKGGKPCSTPHVTEEQVKDAFVRAVNILLSEKAELGANVRAVIAMLCGSAELEKQQAELKEELEVVVGLVERCVAENARTALDQDEYSERYNGLVSRYEAVKAQFDEVTQAIADKNDRKKLLEQFLRMVETQEPVTEFDERLWSSLVDFVTVYREKDIRVTFKDGTEI